MGRVVDDTDRAADRVACRGDERGGNLAGEPRRERGTVVRRQDGSENRDSDRAADLTSGVVHRRAHTGLLAGQRAEDRLRCRREDLRETDRHHDHDEDDCPLGRVDGEHRRITDVRLWILPERHLHTLLARLVVARLRESAVERRVAVHADQVRQRRAGDGGCEHTVAVHGVERGLISAPRVPHVPDSFRVDHPRRKRRLHRRGNTIQPRVAWIAKAEDDVGT